MRDVARAANVLSRQIGGVRTVRDAPGTGRDPLTPVPVAEQREALDVITGSLLSADSFRVSPALQRKLGADFASAPTPSSAARARRRPTTRRRSRCSACSARCSR